MNEEQKRYILKINRSEVKFNIDYEKELNEQQYQIVLSGIGPKLVIAGAGSGKTRTVTYRVARLIEEGVKPHNILLVTFTNKAAKEMMHRVSLLTGINIHRMWAGTFHHIGNLILRKHIELLGYNSSYVILDREDQKDLINSCLAELKIKIDKKRFPSAEILSEIYSLSSGTSSSIENILEIRFPHFYHLKDEIERIRNFYQNKKRETNSLDYDDLLVLWKEVMEAYPAILKIYSSMFEHILVDEYQDTNLIQSEIIDLLAKENRNIMVVGDDSQSIYSFRGANFENIIKFPERYPDCKIYKLEINYRSRPEILQFANQIIMNNQRQFHKELRAVRAEGMKPVVIRARDPNQQAEFVAQRILELNSEGIEFKEMAVLYRAHFHSLELQMELTKRRIPFTITSGLRFFEHRHIKDIVAYIKIINNPYDELAWKRVLKLQSGIGNQTADKLWNKIKESKEIFLNIDTFDELISAKAKQDWIRLKKLLLELAEENVRNKPAAMIDLILQEQYQDYLLATFPDYVSRQEDIEQLRNFALQYSNTNAFLSELALLGNIESEEVLFGPAEDDKVRLSTVHQAKGLEWKVVFVIWLVDGRFPSSKALRDVNGEEEERRLFYVATTRCKDELYLIYPLISTEYYKGTVIHHKSRFLSEIKRKYYDEWAIQQEAFPYDEYL